LREPSLFCDIQNSESICIWGPGTVPECFFIL